MRAHVIFCLPLHLFMMNFNDIFLLAVGLAMDCLTVSVASGVMLRRMEWAVVLRMAFLFGLFQALMPLIGWLLVAGFAESIEAAGHWVAFALLVFIGGKMIWESFQPEEERTLNPRRLSTQLLLAVATSIDALAVGVSMGVTGYREFAQLSQPLMIIGLVSLLFGVVGCWLGVHFGRIFHDKLKPEMIGGFILIGIGFKVLLS